MLNGINRISDADPYLPQGFSRAGARQADVNFSSTLAWAREQDLKDGDVVSTQKGKEHLKAHVEVLTTMLQSVSSNPLQDNGVEGIRVLQGLVEGIARVKQEEKLDDISNRLRENNFFQAASLVGKQGEFISHNFRIGPDSSDEVFYEVSKGSALENITIDLFGRNGMKLASVSGPREDGRHSLMPLLSKLQPGNYAFRVWGVNGEEEVVDVQHIVASQIDSIKNDGSTLLARVGKDFEPLRHLRGVSIIAPQQHKTMVDAVTSIVDESQIEGGI